MTFHELLDEACRLAHLPDMARIQLPNSLTSETKKRVMKLSPEKFGKILAESIDAVNKGSIDSIDALVRKQIEKR